MGDWNFTGQRQMGIFRDGYWYVDADNSQSWSSGDQIFAFGLPGDQPLTINLGDGYLHLAVFRPSESALYVDTSHCNCYSPTTTVRYQIYNTQPTDVAVMVNPDGQGGRLAFWRPSTGNWYMGPLGASGNLSFDLYSATQYQYGIYGDIPVAGDWTGTGSAVWNIGVYRGQSGIWIVDSNGSHGYDGSDAVYYFGVSGDIPVMGPWSTGSSGTPPTTVTSSPPGLQMVIDNTTLCTAPCSFQWATGATHSIGVSSPQSGGSGAQYTFTYWSDYGAQTHFVTVPMGGATYAAYFSFTPNPLTITTTSPLPGGTVGTVYTQSLSATGGTPSYYWTVAYGTPPPGVYLSSSGVLSGVPSAAGSYNFTVRVTDSMGASSTKLLSITIAPPTYSISGQVTSSGTGLSGVNIALTGSQTGSATTDGSGNYSFTGLAGGGSYTVTPSKSGTTFTPASRLIHADHHLDA